MSEQVKTFGDIDIDVFDRKILLSKINHTQASIIRDGKIEPHLTGIYVQDVPTDPVTGLCSLDYQHAEQLGYLKLDILNMSAYQGVRNEAHINELLSKPVMWELFEHEEIVKQLVHIHGHFDIVKTMKPTSIEQLAMIIAMIRPGKRHLVGKSWSEVEADVWTKTEKYSFKKSHAIGYAMAIVVQLQVLLEALEKDVD